MASRLWLPIQQHINDINGSMPGVHHYTSVEGALGILKSGHLWFTERAHLNDPTEIFHGVEIAKEILRAQHRMDDTNRLAAVADRILYDFRFFSSSFSFAYDDPCQWRKYADNGRGVCLSFKGAVFSNPKGFIHSLIPSKPTAFVCPISYESDRLRAVISAMIKICDGTNIEELADYVFMISGMFKSEGWRSEKEYRFFVHHPSSEVVKSAYCETRVRDSRTILYLNLPIQGWNSPEGLPIYRLCLGPAATPETEAQVVGAIRAMSAPPREGVIKSDPSRCGPSPF